MSTKQRFTFRFPTKCCGYFQLLYGCYTNHPQKEIILDLINSEQYNYESPHYLIFSIPLLLCHF